jgi:hypothetical protein
MLALRNSQIVKHTTPCVALYNSTLALLYGLRLQRPTKSPPMRESEEGLAEH